MQRRRTFHNSRGRSSAVNQQPTTASNRGMFSRGRSTSTPVFSGRGGVSNSQQSHSVQPGPRHTQSSSSVYLQSGQYFFTVPPPVRQIKLQGIDYDVQCGNWEYAILCDCLNIPYADEQDALHLARHGRWSEQKEYDHPSEFIADAKRFMDCGNRIMCSEACWGAYAETVKLFYKDLKINIHSHVTISVLAELTAKFSSDAFSLGEASIIARNAHINYYTGATPRNRVLEYIDKIENFIFCFQSIDKKLVAEELSNYLPTMQGEVGRYKNIEFEKTCSYRAHIGGKRFWFDYNAYVP